MGGHLARSLQGDARRLHGTIRRAKPATGLPRGLRRHVIDLTRRKAVDTLVRRLKPSTVFHLAAQSSVAESWKDPGRTLSVNAGAEANLLAALVQLSPLPRVLIVGSTDEYGEPPDPERALDESTPLRPVTPYGVSKVAQDLLGLQYFLSHHLPVVRVRAFNHAGPGQSARFAVSSFALQIARIEQGRQPPRLEVGNLEVRRDFTDVRDMVRAYRLALELGHPGEVYNIGSGRAVALREVVQILTRMSRRPVTVTVDQARLRSVEPPAYRCDPSRFHALTGWQPEIPLEQTLRDTLDYWRKELR